MASLKIKYIQIRFCIYDLVSWFSALLRSASTCLISTAWRLCVCACACANMWVCVCVWRWHHYTTEVAPAPLPWGDRGSYVRSDSHVCSLYVFVCPRKRDSGFPAAPWACLVHLDSHRMSTIWYREKGHPGEITLLTWEKRILKLILDVQHEQTRTVHWLFVRFLCKTHQFLPCAKSALENLTADMNTLGGLY